jgi:hypothetical protein
MDLFMPMKGFVQSISPYSFYRFVIDSLFVNFDLKTSIFMCFAHIPPLLPVPETGTHHNLKSSLPIPPEFLF